MLCKGIQYNKNLCLWLLENLYLLLVKVQSIYILICSVRNILSQPVTGAPSSNPYCYRFFKFGAPKIVKKFQCFD